MKHNISYFYNALLEQHLLRQAWCEAKFVKYRVNKLISHSMLKMSAFGSNTSS